MSTYQDLVDAMRRIQERTGDPLAWQSGLSPYEVTAVLAPITPVTELDAILAKIRQQHAELFNPPPTPPPSAPPSQTPSERADGDAARAIADAEAALAHQNSVTSQIDLQVISAVLNAHLKTVDGRDGLEGLQREIETAVRTRSDLDTPAGARDFQRYLIGKLRDIREVVATASLDDRSKAALMAAWTSLYNVAKSGSAEPGDRPVAPATPRGVGQEPALPTDTGSDPLLDAMLFGDPGLPAPLPGTATTAPAVSNPPTAGGAAAPSGGGVPGLSTPNGFQLPQVGGLGRDSGGLADTFDDRESDDDKHKRDHGIDEDDGQADEHADPKAGEPESPVSGPTTVTLPDGETVTAASPQLAAAIKAAAAGSPIPDAFQQQGITIPQPGTAVTNPVDPARVVAGDIGMFTDRHALALGRNKALLDGQIQHISTVSGPSFLGWEHPPSPAAQASGPAPPQPETPTPTRPSATLTG